MKAIMPKKATRFLAGASALAVAGGMLLLTPSVTADTASAAIGRPADHLAKADEPNEIERCDDEPSDGIPFYGTPSASKTYDSQFTQLGSGAGSEYPNLNLGFTPQGLAYWENWDPAGHPGDDLLLVTSYFEATQEPMSDGAWIYGMDAETGEHVGTAAIAPSHVGGIAVYKRWAYVSAKGSAAVNRFGLGELRDDINGEEDDPELQPEAKDEVAAAAFLTTDGSILYAGPYKGNNDDDPFLRSYAIQDDGSIEDYGTRRFLVPRRTQGMTIANGRFVYSTSPYFGDQKLSYLFSVDERTDFEPAEAECLRVPSMSEEIVTHEDKVYLAFESGSARFPIDENDDPPDNRIRHLHVGELESDDDGPDEGETKTTYDGPTEADFHDPFAARARLTDWGGPTSGAILDFTLGEGGASQTCSGTTDPMGVASCSLTPTQQPGPTTLTASFAGGAGLGPSSDTVSFTVNKQQTEVRYTGPERVANGTPARLSAVLTEESADGPPVAGRAVTLALGKDDARQECTGTTDGDGVAACTVDRVSQPLNDEATVPVSVAFDGDAFYQGSTASSTVLLEYYTGRAYGVSADLGLLGASLPPKPDTGAVRTAQATQTDPGCTAALTMPLLRAGTLCPQVVTSLAPGTSRTTATVEEATVGVPGLPVIEIEGATARSTSTCGSGGSASGRTDLN
ncbi:MAG: choice-of-anchor P family protein, partial [Nocardioidaceae bacterium]